jgi:Trk-type K+ transport system membrane component
MLPQLVLGPMQAYLSVTSLAYFVMISSGLFTTLILFLDRNRYERHKRLHHGWFILLIVWFVLAVISQPAVMKVYAALSVVLVIVVEAVIRKRRKNAAEAGSVI